MSDSPDRTSAVLADISEHLGGLFRHMLPGVLLVAGTRLAHPSWFEGVDSKSWHHLFLLAVLAIVLGNTWFSLNRYAVYQFLDYLLYYIGSLGPAKGDSANYLDDLGKFTYRSLHTGEAAARARQHVAFRASTVLLVFTLGELAIIFGFWHGNDSVLVGYSTWLVLGGIVTFPIGIWQELINRRIDYYTVNPPNQP